LSQNSQLSLVATNDALVKNKLISNKPLSIEAQGDTLMTTSIGSLELSAATSSSMYANNGNINMIVSDGAVFPQFTVKNDSSLLLIEDSFFPALNHMEFRYNRIVSKGSPLTNQAYINFNPNSNTIYTSPRELSNIMTYVNELPGSGVLPSVVSPTAQVAFSQFVFTGATLITPTPLNFTVLSPGVLRYDGTETRWFNINIEIGVVSAAADQVVQMVLLDAVDAVIPATLSQFYTSTVDRNGGTSVNITLQLSNLNQIKIAVRTPRAATSLTLENYKLQVIEN
jgi:hypothetical protein